MVDSSTIDPAVSQEMALAARDKSAVYMDAPVSGGESFHGQTLLCYQTCSSRTSETGQDKSGLGKNGQISNVL